jgi:hypothetical protein
MKTVQAYAAALRQALTWLAAQAGTLKQLVTALADTAQQVRLSRPSIGARAPHAVTTASYDTRWLSLVLDLKDGRGRQAVLSRTQRVRFLRGDGAIVRELVWGEGDQLVRYRARGARRVGTRAEGSKRVVLLDPEQPPAVGDELTVSSRRTLRDAFGGRDEYCEAFLERPTGRLDIIVTFPRERPPRAAQLVAATTEQVVRTLRARYSADGRAVLHCRLRNPKTGVTYSLRWSW